MKLTKDTYLTLLAVGLVFGATTASADYTRTSAVEGFFCSGFVIKKCEFKSVDAISEQEDTQLFEMSSEFSRVDEFNKSSDRCHLRNNVGWTDPKFHAHRRIDNNKWEYLGIPDSFTFKCTKQ